MNTTFIFGIVVAIISISMLRESNASGIPVMLAAALFVYLSFERCLRRYIRERTTKKEKKLLDGSQS
jgi:Ca2+/Na+ antiporter